MLDDAVDVTVTRSRAVSRCWATAPSRSYKAADLLAEAATTTFDGFVLDWVVSERIVIDLVRFVRTKSNVCSIIILTGRIDRSDR